MAAGILHQTCLCLQALQAEPAALIDTMLLGEPAEWLSEATLFFQAF